MPTGAYTAAGVALVHKREGGSPDQEG